MRKLSLGLLLSVLALVVAVGCSSAPAAGPTAAPAAQASKTFKIGNILPLTGFAASTGQTLLIGQQKAVDDINAAGGVLGAKLELVTADSRADATEGTALVKKQAEDKDIYVLHIVSSIETIAGMPLYEELGIPVVSSGSSAPWQYTTYKGVFNKFLFRQQLIADAAVPVMMGALKAKLNLKKVATIFDVKNDWAVNNKTSFLDVAQKLNLEVTATESATTGDTDFRAQITKIMPTNPDLVFVSMTGNEKGLFIRQARDAGWKVQFMDLLAEPKDFGVSGGAEEGIISAVPFDATENRAPVKKLVDWHKSKYDGKDPAPYTALGYDNVLIIADAAKRAGKLDRLAIRDALGTTKNFEGACGFYTWDVSGDNKTPIIHYVTFNKDGVLVPYKL